MRRRSDRHERVFADLFERAVWAVVAACGLLSAACSVVLQRDSNQCRASADCQVLAAGAVCTTDGVCQAVTGSTAAKSAGPPCVRDADCAEPSAICQAGSCRNLNTGGCVASDRSPGDGESLPIGVLVPSAELDGAAAPWIWGAALTAVSEINRAAASSNAPRLITVACSDADPSAIEGLRDAGIVVFLGPSEALALQRARQTLDGAGILFAPSADAPSLMSEKSRTSVVTCKPNAGDLVAADLSAIKFLRDGLEEFGKVEPDTATVLAISDVEKTQGFGLGLTGANDANVREVVYEYDPDGADLTTKLEGMKASLLVAASDGVDWSDNMTALEGSTSLRRQPPPFYLLKGKQLNALDVIQADPKTLLDRRTVGRTGKLTERSQKVRTDFAQSFREVTHRNASPDSNYVHDCAYLAFYAAVAAQRRYSLSARDLTPGALLVGLRAVVGGDSAVEVGEQDIPDALAKLDSVRGGDAAIRLVGGSGPLELVNVPAVDDAVLSQIGRYLRPMAGDIEFYCVEATARTFCDTGLSIPSTGGPVSGDNQCDCFPFE